jgi:flagellar M-ring protein FliF
VSSFTDTLKKLGPARLSIMGAVVLGLLMFFVFVSMRVSAPDMKVLYTDLTPQDSAAVAAKLEELQIRYQVSADGTKVTAPEADIGRARMVLAQEGLPNGGSMGYEIFDKQSNFGTTNFVQNINQVRALEGELSRTINSLEPVKSSRVHLVLPQRELFSRESRDASASVFLHLKAGQNLSRTQIAGIQSLIASAVPDLKTRNVSIVDNEGNLLASGGEDENTLVATKSEELRRNYESRMMQTIEDLVGRTVGFGKVRAKVTADLNFDRVTQNEEVFDPASQVVRSTQSVTEENRETGERTQDVSVQNNLPGGQPNLLNEGAGPSSEGNRNEETTNFEISKTTRSLVRETGEVKKLSVAVLVDGTYTTNDKGERVYAPRSAEELQRLETLVKSAIGFDESRGDKVEVVNMQFVDATSDMPLSDDKIMGFDKSDILDAVEVLTVAIMIILVVLLVLQPMVGRLLASETLPKDDGTGSDPNQILLPGGQGGMQPALTGPGMAAGGAMGGVSGNYNTNQFDEVDEASSMIDVQKVEGRVKASSLKKVEDIVNAYPEETVSVLRNWMATES